MAATYRQQRFSQQIPQSESDAERGWNRPNRGMDTWGCLTRWSQCKSRSFSNEWRCCTDRVEIIYSGTEY
jgi:hypothetical protein